MSNDQRYQHYTVKDKLNGNRALLITVVYIRQTNINNTAYSCGCLKQRTIHHQQHKIQLYFMTYFCLLLLNTVSSVR